MAPIQATQHQPNPSAGEEKRIEEFKSRKYQDEILKACIERNTIIYLPTGAGKTYIAIMALKHFAKPLEKSISEGGKRSVFLTNTQALARQQAEVIGKMTALNVRVYTGDMDVDNWNREKWTNEFESAQVITATVQIVLDVVRHGYMKITDFNLMIFDECHNAQKDHPMLLLMAKFNDYPPDQHPRVIGLTGMLTAPSIKPGNVLEDLRNLEARFQATIKTAQGDSFKDVLIHSTCPTEKVIEYEKNIPSDFQAFLNRRLEKMIKMINEWPLDEVGGGLSERRNEKQPKIQKKFETICKEFIYQLGSLGSYGGTLANLAAIVDLELKKREACTTGAKWVSRSLITSFEEILHMSMQKVYDDDDDERMQIDDDDDNDEIDEESVSDDPSTIILKSSHQVQKLLLFIKKAAVEKKAAEEMETAEEKKGIKGLIFVQRRYTARILCHVIRRYFNAPENKHLNINIDFMTGRNAFMPDSIETILTNKNNNQVLDKFKRGTINLIIATSVLEEGIDLQECNLVVSFDVPQTFRAYVQSKGRARMRNSTYAIMTPAAETVKLSKKKAEWEAIMKILKTYLVERAVDRPPPQQDDIDKAIEQKYNETLKTKKGATCDYLSSISLLNRYCTSLPRDQFTDPLPQWEDISVKGLTQTNFVVKIILPIQSPCKEEIQSKPLPTLKLAKRSAAFEAIKKLYEYGELSENLMPYNRQKCLERFDKVYFDTWTEFKNDDPKRAGTKKNNRSHNIEIPTALKESMPQINKQCYLYEINIRPNFQIHETQEDFENIRIFHNLLKSTRTYGILTTRPLPRMAEMKFFQSFGQINCKVAYEPVPIKLGDANKLRELKRFHTVLFRNVLNIWKEFFVYDHTDSVIIVPTFNGGIDWSMVQRFQVWHELETKSILQRQTERYDENEWRYSVVCPWYRVDTDVRYVVTEVATHKTPLSPFPNDQYSNYADYVTEKYSEVVRIVNTEQFLIGVKPITSHLNRLNAGDGDDGGRKSARSRGPEYLIPELCHNFMYPGDLWLKAIVLPSALHRIQYILHAESLRIKIDNYIGLNIANYEPKPLIDSMARNKRSYAKSGIQNAIVHPKIEETTAKELTINDIARFDDEHAGKEDEEPIDLERYFDNVHEIDIDYYFQYINRNMANLSINTDNNAMNRSLLSPQQFQKEIPALCDVKEVDKVRISLLNIKLATPLSRGIEQHEMLAAITSASSADVFHNEILEVLGDAFLKFSTSLYLIQRHIDWHEGFLTTIKSQMVGNRNLCYSAIRHGLPGMIKIHNFNPKEDWQPPMLKVSDLVQVQMKEFKIKPDLLFQLKIDENELENGYPSDEKFYEFVQKFLNDLDNSDEDSSMLSFLGLQRLSDKTCADCIEAILGTCVKTVGIERTFKVLEMLEIVPRNGMDITKMLQKRLRSPRIRTDISNDEVDYFLVNHRKLEESIGYRFNDRAYLLQALTHPSYPTNRVTGCYQQLEFLGDAVLDFLITAYITERCVTMDPGQLTDLRSALVNNVTLACLCVRYNIHVHILYQNSMLSEAIERFVDFQHKQKNEVTDHVELLMEESDVSCKMAEYTDVPKTLGDVFEAIIGGIFLDSGNDLEKTWQVIYRLMKTELDKFMAKVPIQLVRQLYEYPNANPEFDEPIVDGEDVLVNLRFTCNGEIRLIHGFGVNKDNAKRAAAKLALSKLTRS